MRDGVSKRAIGGFAALAAAALAACGGEPTAAPSAAASSAAGGGQPAPVNPPGLAVGDARVQLPAVPGRPGVAYFTVSQGSGAPRTIVAVRVAGAGRAELHASRKVDGVSRMEPVASVPVGAGQSVSFAPGGYHVMLFDVDPMLAAGSTADLTVTFDNGDEANAKAQVVAAGAGAMH